MRSIIQTMFLGLFAGLWEVCVRPFFPNWFEVLILVPIITLLVSLGFSWASLVVAGLSGAFVIDFFSFGEIRFMFARVLLIILILDSMARSVFTNRSLYAAIGLMLLARLLDFVLVGSAYVLAILFHLSSEHEFVQSASPWVFVWDMAFVIIGFMICARFSSGLTRTRYVDVS